MAATEPGGSNEQLVANGALEVSLAQLDDGVTGVAVGRHGLASLLCSQPFPELPYHRVLFCKFGFELGEGLVGAGAHELGLARHDEVQLDLVDRQLVTEPRIFCLELAYPEKKIDCYGPSFAMDVPSSTIPKVQISNHTDFPLNRN